MEKKEESVKIIQIICQQKTGIGTYTTLGLGEDSNVYEWKEDEYWYRYSPRS